MKYLVFYPLAAIVLLLSNCKKESKVIITVPVTSVTLNKDSLNILINNGDSLMATVSPGNATNGKVNWSSSDNTIATVDDMGHISGKKVGHVTITAASQDGTQKASCPVKVEDMGYFIKAVASYGLESLKGIPVENVFFTITNNSAYPVNIVEWDVYNSKNVAIGTETGMPGKPIETAAPGVSWTTNIQSFNIGLYEPGQTGLQNWNVLALFNCNGKNYVLSMNFNQATVTNL